LSPLVTNDTYKVLANVNLLVSIFLFLDIYLSFRTAYYTKRGKLVKEREQIKKQYWKSWFLLDLLSSLPVEYLFINLAPPFRVLNFIRVLRSARVYQFLHQLERYNLRQYNLIRLSTFILFFLIIAHAAGCLWILLDEERSSPLTFDEYFKGFYWAITTLASVGYGDITPKTTVQRMYVVFVMFIGVGFYSYVIGNIVNLVANFDIAKAYYFGKMQRVSAFMRYNNIPLHLQREIFDYYDYLWENRTGNYEFDGLSDLPQDLMIEVKVFISRDIIQKVPIFNEASPEFIREIVIALKSRVCIPGEFIVRRGDLGDSMYFISSGSAEVLAEDGKTVIVHLKDGDFFGEIALLKSTTRTVSVRATDYCSLYYLEKESFDKVLENFPHFAQHLHAVADRRLSNDASKSSE
jgi:voltage-gated potassium channel